MSSYSAYSVPLRLARPCILLHRPSTSPGYILLSMRLPSWKEATARVRPMLTESPLPGATNSQNSPCCHAGKPRVVGMAQWVTSTHVEDASAGAGASSFVRHSAFGMLTGRPWRA